MLRQALLEVLGLCSLSKEAQASHLASLNLGFLFCQMALSDPTLQTVQATWPGPQSYVSFLLLIPWPVPGHVFPQPNP